VGVLDVPVVLLPGRAEQLFLQVLVEVALPGLVGQLVLVLFCNLGNQQTHHFVIVLVIVQHPQELLTPVLVAMAQKQVALEGFPSFCDALTHSLFPLLVIVCEEEPSVEVLDETQVG